MNAEKETATERRYWALTRDDDDIAWLAIDCPDQSTNTLSVAVLEELGGVIEELTLSRPRGLVVYSSKESGFIVGADVREFKDLGDPDEAARQFKAAIAIDPSGVDARRWLCEVYTPD